MSSVWIDIKKTDVKACMTEIRGTLERLDSRTNKGLMSQSIINKSLKQTDIHLFLFTHTIELH